jgi:hypothetical protein
LAFDGSSRQLRPEAASIALRDHRRPENVNIEKVGPTYFLNCYLKTLPALAGQGRAKSEKSAAGFGIILGIKGWGCYGKRNRKSDSCVSAE